MVDLDAYLALRNRPKGRAAMRQTWLDLTFLHFSADPAGVQATLPNGLTVDTFPDEQGRERAWIGLVPFRMTGIRFEGTPAIPGCHAFPETNVRTYVHRQGREPGVWFYSLDAANPFACAYARRFFGLPYFAAAMHCRRKGNVVRYRSSRRRDGARVDGSTLIEGSLPALLPGTLEFFLIERYLLYARKRGELYTGKVFHKPYELNAASFEGQESLLAFASLEPRPWESCLYSPGVSVEIFSLTKC